MKFEQFTKPQLIHMIRMYNQYFPNFKIVYSGLKKDAIVNLCRKHMMIIGYRVLSNKQPRYELNLQAVSTKY